MPIDLKWVRSNPEQVREWQSLRKRQYDDGSVHDNDVESTDLVDEVLRKDELSRKNLQTLQEHKKDLKQLQLRLRPKKNQSEDGEDDREEILKEKKSVEAKIKLAEADWKASLEDTHKTLCRLASPVTNMKPNDYDLDASQVTVTPCSLPFGHAKSSLGMDLEQAWRKFTLCHFADYLWVELPRGIPVLEKSPLESSSDFAFVTLDRAQELWGPTPSPDADCQVMLPSWIRLLTEFLPSKSIWGEKELPRYTAIWSKSEIKTSSLELVAVMAPSIVDAREIQNKLVQELLSYYGDLLPSQKNMLKRIVVSAPDLHNHEQSRIEIHVACSNTEGDKINTLRLGWVSHWGDAATRACDMSFAGGGVVQAGGKKKFGKKNASKEFVHLVEASVIDNSTWNKILYANSNAAAHSNSDGNDWLVNVPPVLVPHLVRPISNSTNIPLKDLFLDDKSKRKKKDSVFGVLGKKKNSEAKILQQEPVATSGLDKSPTQNTPKFPPLGVASFTSKEELQKRIRMEKLSCLYDFLFD